MNASEQKSSSWACRSTSAFLVFGKLSDRIADVDPLHLDVPALPPRQRLVRRLPAAHRPAVMGSAWAKATFGAGAIYTGLIYPIAVCLLTVLVGGLLIRETKHHKLDTPIDESAAGGRSAALELGMPPP